MCVFPSCTCKQRSPAFPARQQQIFKLSALAHLQAAAVSTRARSSRLDFSQPLQRQGGASSAARNRTAPCS